MFIVNYNTSRVINLDSVTSKVWRLIWLLDSTLDLTSLKRNLASMSLPNIPAIWDQSCPRVRWTRGSGRVGSRFCRILSGRVSTSEFLVFYLLFLGTWIDRNLRILHSDWLIFYDIEYIITRGLRRFAASDPWMYNKHLTHIGHARHCLKFEDRNKAVISVTN